MDVIQPTVNCWYFEYFAFSAAWQRPGGARRQTRPRLVGVDYTGSLKKQRIGPGFGLAFDQVD